jgi:hypothetical protein
MGEIGGGMKTVRLLLKGTVAILLLTAAMCTTPKYDNPLDVNGDAYVPGDPCAEDDDGDGKANSIDPDGPAACHPKSQPTLTLVGDSVIVIPLTDPNQIVPGLRSMAHATDPLYGNLDTFIVVTGDVFTTECSTFTLTYTVSNIANVKDMKTRKVIVDCVGPEIVLKGDNPMYVNAGGAYTEPGATAIDKVSGPATVTNSKAPSTAFAHEDSVTYTSVDAIGNKSYAKRVVIISKATDTVAPVITLIGSSEITLTIGVGEYIEPGWVVSDNVDKPQELHDRVKVSGSVDVTKTGTYTLYYNVSDNSGNPADPKSRLIHITPSDTGPDNTKPEIRLLGKTRDTVKVGDTWKEPGFTVWDNRDTVGLGDSVKVIITNAGGSAVPSITTTTETYFRINYTPKDKAGNTGDVTLRIVVVSNQGPADGVAPKLKLEGKAKDTIGVGTPYVDVGATATDSVPGNPKLVILTPTRVITNSSGATVQFNNFYKSIDTYTFTYSVKDAAGNPAPNVTRSVYVRDTAAIAPDSMFKKYGVPLADSLPPISHTWNDTPFVVDGAQAVSPKMKSVKEFQIAWDGRQVNQFSLSLWSGTYMNFTVGGSQNKLTHTFGSANPKFSISGSNISKLDGEYYIIATTKKCVWVRTDGSFAITFK